MKPFTNKDFPASFREACDEALAEKQILFSVVGDLGLNGKYGDSALVFTENEVFAFDKMYENNVFSLPYAEIEEAKVKRFYGNAIFRVKLKSGESKNLIRFSYAAADMGDAAAVFINEINENGYSEELLGKVESTFLKMRCFCPKCGRKLASPEAECLNCTGKGKIFSKLAKYALPEKKSLLICLLLSLFTTAMALIPPYITKYMVDTVLPNRELNKLLYVILFLIGVYILEYGVGAVRSYLLRLTGDRIVVGLKKDIYEKAQHLPMGFYDKTSTGSVINRVNSDTAVLQSFVLKISQEAVVQFFMLFGILAIMLALNWKLTLFSLVPIPFVVIVGRRFGKLISPKYRRIWRRGAAISSILADTIPGIRVVKAFTNEKTTVSRFGAYCDDWMNEDKQVAKIAGYFPAIMTFLVTLGSVIIWFSGGTMIINGSGNGLTVGLLVSFISYASMFYNPVNFFANLNDSYQNTLASAEKVLDILDAEPEHDFGKGKIPERLNGKIEFRNVNFSFDRSKKILSDINLVIEPGDIVGIVGTTGSGKSTLINLLMRYYDEYDGEILIDGNDIRDIDMQYFRSQIGFVQQEPLMFKDTIFNNIAYGNPNVHVEQVLHAADIANAHGFICRLPDAYDTLLGERGVGLSGGEKQRVSIARAIIKNPAILVFDEATAAVDSETEQLIQSAIERLIRGRTTLMIAHRLSTLRKANKIIVVDKGEVIEFGTPEELLAKKGKYYKLIEIQSMGEKLLQKKQEENFE